MLGGDFTTLEVAMFVIMGATGQVGGAALEALKQRGIALRAVSRDPARARAPGV